MIQLQDFEAEEELYRGRRSAVFRGVRISSRRSVVVKTPSADFPSETENNRLRREYEIGKSLNHPNVIRYFSLEFCGYGRAVIMEDFGAVRLAERIPENGISVAEFLDIGIQLADGLAHIHEKNIVHKDINPENIVIHPESRIVKFIDFGLSSSPDTEPVSESEPRMEGTPAFISPEQTGRIRRMTDFRSDFYSLGVTFYLLITGSLPFPSKDLPELLHSHIARRPTPPRERRPSAAENTAIPEIISAIIMKLLEKNPEDRYRSASGLKFDLERCRRAVKSAGGRTDRIPFFLPGRRDSGNRLEIPERLYGRDEETDSLARALDRVCRGNAETLMISGPSGIGKTALMREFRKHALARGAFFLSGKCESGGENLAYGVIIQAFRGLIVQLSGESEPRMREWKARLADALSAGGKLITDIIPEAETIIGKLPPIPPAESADAVNRLGLVFQHFVGVFAGEAHPLVLFLDDLQWADPASLSLIHALVSGEIVRHLLVIGAYRDNEVDDAHPLKGILKSIENSGEASGGRIGRIRLHPLDVSVLDQIIQDTFTLPHRRSAPLSQQIYEKTEGNPFFIRLFLDTAFHEGAATRKKEGWTWDMDALRRIPATENVIALMNLRIHDLPDDAKEILKIAACAGNPFSLMLLSRTAEKTPERIQRSLTVPLEQGMVTPMRTFPSSGKRSFARDAAGPDSPSDTYRFAHDAVFQAVLDLTSESFRREMHLNIGYTLLDGMTRKETESELFEITEHLNAGAEAIEDSEKIGQLPELNLRAGKKAKTSAAFASAARYLRTGLSILHGNPDVFEDYRKNRPNLVFELFREAAECEYLTGNYSESRQLLDEALKSGQTALQKGTVSVIRIRQLSNQGRYSEAITLGIEALRDFNLHLPELREPEILEAYFDREMKWFDDHWGTHRISDIHHLPVNEKPGHNMMMTILGTLLDCAIIGAPGCMNPLIITIVNQSVRLGNTITSVYAYLWMGGMTASLHRDYRAAFAWGEASLKLHKTKFRNSGITSKLLNAFGCFLVHFRQPVRTVPDIFEKAYQAGLASGDFLYAAYSATNRMRACISACMNLESLEAEFDEALTGIGRLKNRPIYELTQSGMGFVLCMRGKTAGGRSTEGPEPSEDGVTAFDFSGFRENAFRRAYAEQPLFIAFLENYKIMACCLLGKHREALDRFNRTDFTPLENYIHAEEVRFFSALSMTALYPDADENDRRIYWENIQEHRGFIQKMAETCPENFKPHDLILSAEIARIRGAGLEAADLFEQAVQTAGKNGLICCEALANELAAKLWMGRGNEKIAAGYMAEAHGCYRRWGAAGKTAELETRYPSLVLQEPCRTPGTLSVTGTFSESMDLMSVTKASQAISGEIHFENLLKKITEIIVENAGAQKGFLILGSDGKLLVEAAAATDSDGAEVLKSVPVEDHPEISARIVRYVSRTGERVVLGDAALEGPFVQDSHILKTKPRSILCAPLNYQEKRIGILYLENSLISHAFSAEHTEVLDILIAQAAISLENARLFEQLRRTKGRLRERELFIRQVMNTVPNLVYIYDLRERRNIYANDGSVRLLGYSPEEIRDYGSELFLKIIHPDDLEKVTQHHARLEKAGDGEILDLEYRLKHADGKWRFFHSWDTVFLRDADGSAAQIAGAASNVTERRKAEDDLKKTRNYLANILNSSPSAIIGVNGDRIIIAFNPAAEKLAGLSLRDAVGKSFSDVLPHSAFYLRNIRQILVRRTPQVFEKIQKIHHGSVSFFDISVYPLTTDGVEGVVLRIDDVTSRVRLEEMMIQTEKMMSVGGLAAGMAHEINNPLGGIVQSVQNILRRISPELVQNEAAARESGVSLESVREYLEKRGILKFLEGIRASGDRAAGIVSNMLQFSRTSESKMAPTNLTKLLERTVELASHDYNLTKNYDFRRIEIVREYGTERLEAPCVVTEIEQVVLNLLRNAAQAMSENRPDSPPRIIMRLIRTGTAARIEVEDNGPGMDDETRKRIFDPFYTTKAPGAGTGLGLSVSYFIVVKNHNGEMTVTSEPGKGTKFTVYLPI